MPWGVWGLDAWLALLFAASAADDIYAGSNEREHDHEWWIEMDLERRGHDLCHLMLGRLETTRKLMKISQCLGISEPCTVWLYSVHHYHYTNLCHGLKMVYVKIEVGTQKPYLHKVYRQRFEATLSEIQSRYTNNYTVILLWWKLKNLDVLLTVHFSIYLHVSSTMCSKHVEAKK